MSRSRSSRSGTGLDLHPPARRGGEVNYRVKPHYIQARKAAEHPEDSDQADLVAVGPGRARVDVAGAGIELRLPESRRLLALLGGAPADDGWWWAGEPVGVLVSRRWSLLRVPVDSRTDACFVARWR